MLRDLPRAVLLGVRAALARLLLALVFGGLALLLAGSVVDNLVERMGDSARQVQPAPQAK